MTMTTETTNSNSDEPSRRPMPGPGRMSRFFSRVGDTYRDKGIGHVLSRGFKKINDRTMARYYQLTRKGKTFNFRGIPHPYLYHFYNCTWRNERIVEVPVVWEIVKKYAGKRILEIGNVLSHYYPVHHDIVDKYEVSDITIPADVVDFKPAGKYDLIVSISTLEHVGWDEEAKDPDKLLRALANLNSMLADGGQIVVTMPLGFNPHLDKRLKESTLRFSELYFLKRISQENEWIESTWDDVKDVRYGHPFQDANGLLIGIIRKE